jgi:hypothetical protein
VLACLIDPYQEIYFGVACIGVAIASWKKELFILLDDAIVELAIHKTLDLRKEPDFIFGKMA